MKHYFPVNRISIQSEKHLGGHFTAVETDNDEASRPIGFGQTRLEAIADLYKKLAESGEMED